jgi:choline dehydrogenase-like flavoprotein
MEMRNIESCGISWRAAPRGLVNLLEYALFRSGPLASNVFEATGFIRTLPGLSRPDVQVVFQAARRKRNAFPFPLGHGFAISIVGLYPKSRGRVRLASKGSPGGCRWWIRSSPVNRTTWTRCCVA